MKTGARLVLPSFAKINWCLTILGKRRDGYHELRTVFQTVDLCEQIVFETLADSRIEVKVEGKKLPEGKGNLLYGAADLLRTVAGSRGGVGIFLKKRIPVAAGLGGGSSNAAMGLLALNQLWKCGLTGEDLARLGAQLGSDVPFFLVGGTALGLGRGEKVIPLPDLSEESSLIVLYPDLAMPTKEAYELGSWETWTGPNLLTKKDLDTTIQRFHPSRERGDKGWASLENDFEEPVFRRYPFLAEVKRTLQEIGCERVMLCGSGSALWGLIPAERVEKAVEAMSKKKMGEVFLCQTLSRKRHRQILKQSGLSLAKDPLDKT